MKYEIDAIFNLRFCLFHAISFNALRFYDSRLNLLIYIKLITALHTYKELYTRTNFKHYILNAHAGKL